MVPGVGGPLLPDAPAGSRYHAGSLPVASTANVMRVNVNPKQPPRLLTVSRPARALKVVSDVERPTTPLAEDVIVPGEHGIHGVWRSRLFLPSDGGRRRPGTTLRKIVPSSPKPPAKVVNAQPSRAGVLAKRDDEYGNGSEWCRGRCPLVATGAHRSTFSPASAAPFKPRWTARAARSGNGPALAPLPRAPGETPPPSGVLRLAADFPTIRDPQRRPPARNPRRQTSATRQFQ